MKSATEITTRAQARRMLIRIAQRRAHAGSGSDLAFLRQRTMQMRFPDLTETLRGLNWAVIGAGATRLYMPERLTADRGVLVALSDAGTARGKLIASGAQFKAELSIGGSAWTLPSGFPLDVLEGREEWTTRALAEAQTNPGLDGMPVLPLPYLTLMKMRASRAQDIADISRMLGQATDAQLEQVRAVFTQWSPDEREDLESLIVLGKLEMEENR